MLNDNPICSSTSSENFPPFFFLIRKIFKFSSRVSELYIDQNIGPRRRQIKRHTAYSFCKASLWPTLYVDTHMQPTSLSWAFDLHRNMSRVFRRQKARHKQRKCNASEPFSVLQLCSLIRSIFTFCMLFFSFEVKNVSGTLAADSFLMRAATVAVTDG